MLHEGHPTGIISTLSSLEGAGVRNNRKKDVKKSFSSLPVLFSIALLAIFLVLIAEQIMSSFDALRTLANAAFPFSSTAMNAPERLEARNAASISYTDQETVR